ncbi:MAG TPA: virulence protein SciE type [Sedimenticola sp.]|nr:virulence protein SciE type [Sedimenticola sp.]
MLAEHSLHQGNLEESLALLQDQIRKEPSNAKHRIFLFQLLAVLGQWERALTQLNVVADLDAGALAMVQAYREAIRCEVLRSEVFAGARSPLVFGKPAQWIALLTEALRLTAQGEHAQSQKLRDQAFELAPATSGVIDGASFTWIADADMRMGPVLEAIVAGRYYWIPFQRIRTIRIEEPADLRDIVWMPAHFTWANGGETVGMIPTRYPGSENSDDNLIRSARKTDWIEQGSGLYIGTGQRMLATDTGEFPLMDVRAIDLNSQAEPTDDADPEAGA